MAFLRGYGGRGRGMFCIYECVGKGLVRRGYGKGNGNRKQPFGKVL